MASNPLEGANCDEIKASYFSYPIKSHLVLYNIESETLKVVRVLGADMNHIEHFQ